jgi:3-phenylpropionate/cinnamic acid dioxygenase small subunit
VSAAAATSKADAADALDASADAALERELADFVADEAALLDAGCFDAWLALFADDGRYWVPLLGAAQADPFSHQSLACEDKLLLALRVARLQNPRAHSQHPPSRCQHVLQRSRLEPAESGGEVRRLRTPFVYVEARGESELMLAGTCRHALVRVGAAWKIREKRVDLLQPGRPLPIVQLFV